jgi:hypothetical protein
VRNEGLNDVVPQQLCPDPEFKTPLQHVKNEGLNALVPQQLCLDPEFKTPLQHVKNEGLNALVPQQLCLDPEFKTPLQHVKNEGLNALVPQQLCLDPEFKTPLQHVKNDGLNEPHDCPFEYLKKIKKQNKIKVKFFLNSIFLLNLIKFFLEFSIEVAHLYAFFLHNFVIFI